ncbi:PKD domain-containing protein [Shewanella marina]|uniref:PKD domain-containing protein n=1 Tax=Shewanella marina TaxID=487319 RepID=UPI0004707797|nr:PKD domain-containing protein [Shewanella marina]
MTDGYLPQELELIPAGEVNADMMLDLNANCTAPGYAFNTPSFQEKFEGTFPPTGWSTTALNDTTTTWVRSDETGRGNITNTEGYSALADSDDAGFVDVDTVLMTPTLNVAELENTVVEFVANHRTYTGADSLDLEIMVDGGEWQSVLTLDNNNTPKKYSVDLAEFLDGATAFALRWHYYDANYEWYAAVDDVVIGTPDCVMQDGQMVAGYISDANTMNAIIGANVKSGEQVLMTSVVTEADDMLADGFVYGFIPAAADLTVMANKYPTVDVNVGDFTLATPVEIGSGYLEADAVDIDIITGQSTIAYLDLFNTGSADLTYRLLTLPRAADSLPYGPFHASGRHFGPKNLNDLNTNKIRYFPEVYAPEMLAGSFVSSFPLNQGFGWGIVFDKDKEAVWVSDAKAGGAAVDQLVEYTSAGALTGNTIATPYVETGGFGADLTYNPFTESYWQINVGGDNCVHEISATTMSVTGDKICPSFSTSQRGLAFDPVSDTYYAGSWNDSIIHQFKPDGEIIRSINVDLGISGLAINPETGHLFVADSGGAYDIFVLDTNTELLDIVAGYHVRLDSDGDGTLDLELESTAGLDIDCNGNLWAVDQAQQMVISFTSEETGVCNWNNIPWLSLNEDMGYIAAGSNDILRLSVDGSSLTQGQYDATLLAINNTPYGNVKIPVTLTVTDNELPVVKFTAKKKKLKVTFKSQSTDPDGSIKSQHWDFGDGKQGWGKKIKHKYRKPGTYTVTLTVTDNHDAQTSLTKTIKVKRRK